LPRTEVFMKWCAGIELFGPGSFGKGRLSETLRPLFTRRAAAARLAGVTRFSTPFWSSAPQRPQFRYFCASARTVSIVIDSAMEVS